MGLEAAIKPLIDHFVTFLIGRAVAIIPSLYIGKGIARQVLIKKPHMMLVRIMSASTLRNKIGVLLLDKPMSLKEVAEALEVTEKKAYNLLKNMFQEERVESFKDEDGQRKYRNSEIEIEAALKRKTTEMLKVPFCK